MSGDVLIATFSGRSLAASTRRAGFAAHVADLFADNDLREIAAGFETVDGDFVEGFDGHELLAALERLASGRQPVGVVCGAGFEDRPELLEVIGARWRLLGNGADVMRELKDPVRFARLCETLGIAHPEIRLDPPQDPKGWLSKRVGAAGGLHIGFASDRSPAPDRYFQRFVSGAPRSALFVASGGRAVVLGFSEQWAAPSQAEPFRYGGACGPVRLEAAHEAAMRHAVEAIAAAVPLVGLGSADFLVDPATGPVLLEINPRPGASLEVFERDEAPLFAMHLAACDGILPAPPRSAQGARAVGYAYLDAEEATVTRSDWPDWVSDRPVPGTVIRNGEPICTLRADAERPDAAMALFAERLAVIKRQVQEETA